MRNLIKTVRYDPPPDARRRSLGSNQPASAELSQDDKEGLKKAASELEKIFDFADKGDKRPLGAIMAALAGNPTKEATDLAAEIMEMSDISLNAQAKAEIGIVPPGDIFRKRLRY